MSRARFVLPLLLLMPVAVRPLAAQVPTPESVIGFQPGSDHRLADYAQILAYYEALAAASDRVVLDTIGHSTLGRPLVLALISDAGNLRERERYREIARRLALVRGVDDAEARRLAAEGRAIIWIDAGLHATEVATAQHTPLFAHWLATDEGEEAALIRERAIVLLMPVMNPDGLEIVTRWYRGNVGTAYETTPLPELYHHYVGHDNNRDWHLFTQAESRAVARQLYHVWFPQIVYNHHQTSPFPGRIWMPPWAEPINPNVDPLVVASVNRIGEHMKQRFGEEGKPGAVSGIVFDAWSSNYMSEGPAYRNMVGLLTETALYRYATPKCYEDADIPATFGERAGGLPAREPTTSYPDPWTGGCWHLADAVDYMMTASRAVAAVGARESSQYLYNIYRAGRRQIERGERAERGPFAYIVEPSAQHDPVAATEMLAALRLGGVEIRRAERPFRAEGREYPAGTYVIPPQAFRPYVVDVMDPKTYPDRRQYEGGPPAAPYDVTGYELPLLFGVEVERVQEPFAVPEREVAEVPPPEGGARGRGEWGWLLAPASNASVRAANRLLRAGASVARAPAGFRAAGERWPAGTYVVRQAERTAVAALGGELGVWFHALDRDPGAAARAIRPPRIGLYRSRVASMPEGWTRWVLEQYEFEYTTLRDADVRAGALDGLDVVILADQPVEQLLGGHVTGTMPAEYTGGLGLEGALRLQRFVEGGGWLVALDRAVDFPIQLFGIPVRNTARGRAIERFFVPGSLVRVTVERDDPLAWGLGPDPIAFFVRSQILEVVPGAEEGELKVEQDVVTFARYAEEDVVASGWALGAGVLAGKGAGMRVPLGRGQVVLLGVSPHFRASPRNLYPLLFNPLHAATLTALPGAVSAGVSRGRTRPSAP
jgi:hypothetical protein